MKVRVLREGQPCRKCGAPVIRKSHDGPTRPNQAYWYKSWLYCPKCTTRYMLESEKVYASGYDPSNNDIEIPAERLRILDND